MAGPTVMWQAISAPRHYHKCNQRTRSVRKPEGAQSQVCVMNDWISLGVSSCCLRIWRYRNAATMPSTANSAPRAAPATLSGTAALCGSRPRCCSNLKQWPSGLAFQVDNGCGPNAPGTDTSLQETEGKPGPAKPCLADRAGGLCACTTCIGGAPTAQPAGLPMTPAGQARSRYAPSMPAATATAETLVCTGMNTPMQPCWRCLPAREGQQQARTRSRSGSSAASSGCGPLNGKQRRRLQRRPRLRGIAGASQRVSPKERAQ